MNYTPQFVYPVRPGEEEFLYCFSGLNTPALRPGRLITPGEGIDNIVLQTQTDAPFRLRGVQMFSALAFDLVLRDPSGRLLSDSSIPLPLAYEPAGLPVFPVPQGLRAVPIAVEPEIPCEKFSTFLLNILFPASFSGVLAVHLIRVFLYGVKEFGK